MTQENGVLEQARVELQGILGELCGIKSRILATGRRLTKAAKTGEVVGTDGDGDTYTLEGWIGDHLPEIVNGPMDEFMEDLSRQVDFEDRRADARAWAEQNTRHAAAHPATA